MANTPANAKKPADHQEPSEQARFSFDHDGTTYTFGRPTAEVITPGWLRRNRKTDELDATYTAIEMLADDSILNVLDNMGFKEHFEVQNAFGEHVQEVMGVSLGEASAS